MAPGHFRTFQKLDARPPGLRSWVTLPGEHRLDDIVGIGLQTGFGNDRLRIGHVKFFSDGGMGARTAWMIDPYLDAGHGMPMMDMGLLADRSAGPMQPDCRPWCMPLAIAPIANWSPSSKP
jgi:predicted amidohydrolase YtcJ